MALRPGTKICKHDDTRGWFSIVGRSKSGMRGNRLLEERRDEDGGGGGFFLSRIWRFGFPAKTLVARSGLVWVDRNYVHSRVFRFLIYIYIYIDL